MIQRRLTRKIKAGNIYIGGDSPITIQSMTSTDTRDIESTCEQISRLEEAGCDIVRMAIVDEEAAKAVKEIKKRTKIPLVADIHFNYRLALECMRNGIDKIRINPGNIGSKERVAAVAKEALAKGIPIRIGINAGSIERDILDKYGKVSPEAMVQSAKRHIDMLLEENFEDIAVSLKASDVLMTIEAYRLMSDTYDYPLHLGVTEAGTLYSGTVKSAIGIGTLLAEGIGDTIRVSLTSDPVNEVVAAKKILSALNIKNGGVDMVSCPTCGRCRVNVIEIAAEIERRIVNIDKNIKIAVMGCAVNGPGEAKEADIGIAGGDNEYLLFKKGVPVRKIPCETAVDEMIKEIKDL